MEARIDHIDHRHANQRDFLSHPDECAKRSGRCLLCAGEECGEFAAGREQRDGHDCPIAGRVGDTANGLNPEDSADAQLDSDGDAIMNLQE